MSLKKAYQYLFYKIYRFSENAPSRWWSDTKAASIMDILLIFIVLSSFIYYNIFIDRYFKIVSMDKWFIALFISIIGFNYYLFSYKNKWKQIVKKFDELPNKKNRLGGWFVFLLICLIFINFFYSIYLKGQVDWSQYR